MPQPTSQLAIACHQTYPLFDGHNDLPHALRKGFNLKLEAVDLTQNQKGNVFEGILHKTLHTDLPRLRAGGAGAQFWSVYVPTFVKGADAVQRTLEQVDVVHRLCEKYPDTLEFAWNAADVKRIFAAGKIASLCGAEGGHQINDSLGVLRMLHRIGVRYMTLTHNGGPDWAAAAVAESGSFEEESPAAPCIGLTRFGCEVVREMNRVGMLVDLSHVHADCMRRAIEVSVAPVIFSHSCTRALCSHPRNVPDDVLVSLKSNGGVCMVTYVTKFVAGERWTKGPKQAAALSDVADHIDHIKAIVGIDYVGLGGDFDGATSLSIGLEDVSTVPALTEELLKRRYSEDEVGKVLGLNIIRVMEKCEKVASELQSKTLPSENTRTDLDGPDDNLGVRAANQRRGSKRPRSLDDGNPSALSVHVYS